MAGSGKKNEKVKSKPKKTNSFSNKPDQKKDVWYYGRWFGVGILLIVGLFLILMPILPQIPYYLRELKGENVYIPHQSTTGSTPGAGSEDQEKGIPEENTLAIPAVGIEVEIVEGATDAALELGAWRRPGSSTPDKGGNTVITGHRFKYLPPSNLTFYHLDKVEVGDDVVVYWEGQIYEYVVSDILVVDPGQVEIESDTISPRITLYTCTPLWTAKKRLVVVAEPEADGEEVPGEEDPVDLESM